MWWASACTACSGWAACSAWLVDSARSAMTDSALLRDVEQREQEDPDDVDEVPVDPDQLHPVELAALRGVLRDEQHQDRARDHVQRVQPRRGVVERPERVRRDRLARA